MAELKVEEGEKGMESEIAVPPRSFMPVTYQVHIMSY